MKSTAKGSDLENVSMSASLLKCNQCTSYWSSRANYVRATCKQCVHGRWLVWRKTFINWVFLLNLGNWPAGEGKLNACRWKGSEAWILPSHCIQFFSNIFLYSFFLFLLSRPVQYSNSLFYSYFCLLIAFKILFVFSYFCFFIACKFVSSHFSISFRSLFYRFLLASPHRIFPLYPSSVFPVLYRSYIIYHRTKAP